MKRLALQRHEEWLAKMGVKGLKNTNTNTIPDYRSNKATVALSNSVGNGYAKKANSYTGSGKLHVGQLYHKGNYGVMSAEDAADPATGKRRT